MPLKSRSPLPTVCCCVSFSLYFNLDPKNTFVGGNNVESGRLESDEKLTAVAFFQ